MSNGIDEWLYKTLVGLGMPFNTTATVYIPKKSGAYVYESNQLVEVRKDIRIIENNAKKMVLEIGSGKYKFQVK